MTILSSWFSDCHRFMEIQDGRGHLINPLVWEGTKYTYHLTLFLEPVFEKPPVRGDFTTSFGNLYQSTIFIISTFSFLSNLDLQCCKSSRLPRSLPLTTMDMWGICVHSSLYSCCWHIWSLWYLPSVFYFLDGRNPFPSYFPHWSPFLNIS